MRRKNNSAILKIVPILISIGLLGGAIKVITTIKPGVSVVVKWKNPTEFENNDLLMSSEIDSFHIKWRNEEQETTGSEVVPGYRNNLLIKGLVPGKHFIQIQTKTVYGTMSEPYTIIENIEYR